MRLILIGIIFLSGCAVQSVKLPLPTMGEVPKIQPAELQCLTNETYEKLRKRDIIRENHADKLESIIRSTH